MNTFVLSFDPQEAASFHCDKHVVKMILESAQMLSTAHWLHLLYLKNKTISDFKRVKDARSWIKENFSESLFPPYAMTHVRHPCTLWTAENLSNYNWQLSLCEYLLEEYTKRYNREHLTKSKMLWLKENAPLNIKNEEMTLFSVCMKDEYKIYDSRGMIDVVESYRNYYIKDKSRFAKWKLPSTPPEWFLKGVNSEQRRLK